MIKVASLFVAWLFFSSAAHAQAPAPTPRGRTIDLAAVIARARQNPPAVLAALATLERTRREEHAAGGAYYPSLSLEASAGIAYQDQQYLRGVRYQGSSFNATGTASVNYALVDAQRSANLKTARAQVEVQDALSHDARLAAIEGAVTLYFQALAARDLVADAQLTLERRSAHHTSIQALVRAGVRPSVDEQRAKIEVVIAETVVRLRNIDEESLASALASALGDDPLVPVHPVSGGNTLPAALTPAEAVKQALAHRPDVLAGRASVRTSMARDQTARAARLPTLGLTGAAQLSEVVLINGEALAGQAFSGSASLYLRWAALDATVWRRAQVSSAAVLEAERALDATLLRAQTLAVGAAYAAQRAHTRVEQAQQVLESAQVTRNSQNERFRAGVATLLELLDAEQVEQNARRERIEAQRDYEVARGRLASACGIIDTAR